MNHPVFANISKRILLSVSLSALPLIALFLIAVLPLGCQTPPRNNPASKEATGKPMLDEVSEEVGLQFTHLSGATGELYIAEAMGAGAALADLDGDGDLDIYLVQGGSLPFGESEQNRHSDRLFSNQLVETGRLHFLDVTEAWGLDATGYGMGVAIADVDDNGKLDIFVANLGPNQLWLQRDPGSFELTAEFLPPDEGEWSVSASFQDFNADQRPDLYIAQYVRFHPKLHRACHGPSSALDYCGPQVYEPSADQLLVNDRGLRFEDRSLASGISRVSLPGLGVVAFDFTEDGRPDIFVSNDAQDNLLWINQGDGSFRDEAILRGVALNQRGQREASMGIALGDFDIDGDGDLFVTHLEGETNTLYANDGRGLFTDATRGTGLGFPSHSRTSFGTAFLHLNGDSLPDLITVSGAVKLFRESTSSSPNPTLHQVDQAFLQTPSGLFREVPSELVFSESPATSRGAAFGDVDNDGDTDLVVTAMDGETKLYLNQLEEGRWVGFLPIEEGRVAVGGRLVLEIPSEETLTAWCQRDGSYASSNDPRVLFRFASAGEILPRITVHWPDLTQESWTDLPLDQYHRLVRGTGRQE